MTIIAAADGSALGNPGPAGWAWYIDAERWRCGGWSRGTNNQGELTAVLDLLRQTAHSDEPLHVLCDSQYVINSITKWMPGWKRKGWKKRDGKPVLNVEIMKALDEAMRGRSVTFEWVKGHAGHELNEKADALANGAAQAHASKGAPRPGPGFPGATAVGAGEDPAAPPTADGSARSAAAPPAAEPDLFSMDDDEVRDFGPPGDSPRADGASVDLVIDLERSLLTDAVRTDRAALESLLHPEWRHVCARGEVWSRDDRLAAVGDAAPEKAGFELIEARELTTDVVLLVWRETGADGTILRSSVWVRSGGDWRQTFQQGTREA
ncbi:RNase H family protein [Dietzia sp. 179-F 9C3 NHS]|uniref:RNase H family protein n=1 Tax=Dietzia sp. 179-F 9C3 NHS TaxID=3374295 RepID=UPI0038798F41